MNAAKDANLRPWMWRLGQIVQGFVLGLMLFVAVIGLVALSGDANVFRYQGY